MKFPAPLEFRLEPGVIRDKVLTAAGTLGLSVLHHNDTDFDVIVRSPQEAYDFGAHCGVVAILSRGRPRGRPKA